MSERRAEEESEHVALTAKSRRMALVLELWRQGVSTYCIADQLEIDEREVCALLEEVREV